MLSDDRCPHRSLGAIYWRLVQHGEEPPLCAALNWRRPGIGASRDPMTGEIEDVHHAFPYHPAFKRLTDRNGLRQRRGAAVHFLDGFAQLVYLAHFGHACTA